MRQVALLRGINLGPSRRIPMAELRERLHEAGHPEARTYLQSGNVLLDSEAPPDALAVELRERLAEWFGLDVPVVVRSGAELEAVVKADPLRPVADNPKYYVVGFLDAVPERPAVEQLAALALPGERVEQLGREIYTWHPAGQARSKLAAALSGPTLGVLCTARNWSTVTTLAEMAHG